MYKNRFSDSCYLAAPLVALAVLSFAGCSGDSNADMAPDDDVQSENAKAKALYDSGKSPREIRQILQHGEMPQKQSPGKKKPQANGDRRR